MKRLRKLVNKLGVRWFHYIYYYNEKQTWQNTYWMGVPVLKCPLDMWIYQEIIYEIKPDFIVETGTAYGGSALFLAQLCDKIGKGNVITIDMFDTPVEAPSTDPRPTHNRIVYLKGDSVSSEIIAAIKGQIGEDKTVLVILDSDHRMEHVINEMRIYSNMVSVGSYLIVEDTNINGHPVLPKFGKGPKEAVDLFLSENSHFGIDRSRDKYFMTFNPGGYLKRLN